MKLPWLVVAALLTACGGPSPSASASPSEEASVGDGVADQPTADDEEPPAPDTQCRGEGERFDYLDETRCCEGLTFLVEGANAGNCDAPPDPGPALGVCSSGCGDGTCQPIENECTCPADCPPSG